MILSSSLETGPMIESRIAIYNLLKVSKVLPVDAFFATLRTDAVRQPPIEKRLIGGAALGQPDVALALKRLESAHQHGLAAGFAAGGKEAVECEQSGWPDAAVGRQVAEVLA